MNWKIKLAQKRFGTRMVVVGCGLDKLGQGWGMTPDQSAFRREDGKFFQMEGAMIHHAGREIAGWCQPFIRENGRGAYIIVTDGTNFLVTLRQEPGNPVAKQHILIGPPFQASLANMQQAHGGKRPPRSEFYDDPNVVWADAPKDGGRFIGSVNRIGVLRLTRLDTLELLPDEIVISLAELKEAFLAGELSPYMREFGIALLL